MRHSTNLNISASDEQSILLYNLSRLAGLDNETSKSGTDKVIAIFELYLTPIIIFVGILGNVLSLAVFSLTHLRRISSSLFLATLSVADILFLTSLAIVWLEKVDVLLYTSYGWCPTVMYVSRVSGCVAAWSVVSFTAERYITVHYPLLKDVICTRKRASVGAALMAVVSFTFYVYIAWSYRVIPMKGIEKSFCSPVARHPYFMSAMIGADTLLSCLVPTVIIILLNACIICKIRKYQQQNRSVRVRYFSRPPGRLFSTYEQGFCKGVEASELIIRYGGRSCTSQNFRCHQHLSSRQFVDSPITKQNQFKCKTDAHLLRSSEQFQFSSKALYRGNRLNSSSLYDHDLRCFHSERHFSFHGIERDKKNYFQPFSSEFQQMNVRGRFTDSIKAREISQKSILSSGCNDNIEFVTKPLSVENIGFFSKFFRNIKHDIDSSDENKRFQRKSFELQSMKINRTSQLSQGNLFLRRQMDRPATRELRNTKANLEGSKNPKQSLRSNPVGNENFQGEDRLRRTLKNRNQYRTAKMLLTLSSITVLLNLPTHAFRIQSVVCDFIGSCRNFYQLSRVSQLIYFLNFAINFFVYNACARQFRVELRRLCSRTRLKFFKCFLILYKNFKNFCSDIF